MWIDFVLMVVMVVDLFSLFRTYYVSNATLELVLYLT